MAIIGMDIHRAFAEVVALEGKSRRRLGRIDMRRDRLAVELYQNIARFESCLSGGRSFVDIGEAYAVGRTAEIGDAAEVGSVSATPRDRA